MDATCAPSNIRYPQDFSLLNEARVKVESIIIRFCKSFGLPMPRMYRRQARKNYLGLAKSKKRSAKKIRATIRKQLSYIKRDIRYLEEFMSKGYVGRPGQTSKADKKIEYQDNTDRIEVERAFSLSKRCYGMGLIRTKLEETTLTSIGLSVFVMNLFKIHKRILSALFYIFRIFNIQFPDLSLKVA